MTDTAGVYATDPLMQRVQLGVNIDHFIKHEPIGRYLIEKAKLCRTDALERLAVTDPEDSSAVRKLQWEAKIPDLLLEWLEVALSEAEAAEEQIRFEDVAYYQRQQHSFTG